MRCKSKLLDVIVSKRQRLSETRVAFGVVIKAINKEQRIVTGEVYAPNVLDTHGEMMEDEDVVQLAHLFMADNKIKSFDVMHDNKTIEAHAVESWIARGHPEYNEGAWVLSTKVLDETVWEDVKSGKIGGYSIECRVNKVEAEVEMDVVPNHIGFTERQNEHDHAFYIVTNSDGVVVGGFTSFDNGHRHIIKRGTRTELKDGHAHRFFLS